MKELINRVMVTGKLVKNGIEEFTTKKGVEAIGGSLILRTSDESEHEINFYSNKYKKDENKNFTNELNYFYKEYMDAKDNLRDIEHCSEGENPDIISITDGYFAPNDFKGNDGNVVSTNKISAKFINKVEPKDYDSTVLEAKFEVEGIIDKLENEIIKGDLTGNLAITLSVIKQMADGFGKNAKYTANAIFPVKMIVDKSMASMFRSAGYYETCFVKFVGKLINSVEIIETCEKQAFGEDVVKKIKNYIRKNEIKSGTAASTIFEHELTQEIVDALRAKRKQALVEIKSGINNKTADTFKPNTSTPAPQTNYNPFAQ